MIRDDFRILKVDLADGKGQVVRLPGRDEWIGGSGLSARLFQEFGHADRPWDDADQPLILAIGPLTGYFPLMSKTVCAFKSPYHDQFAESHAGGRSALCLRFADLDALVIAGRAARPSILTVGSRNLAVTDAHFLWGQDVQQAGKAIRRMVSGSGHRSILRIGPAGENRLATACINVDTYRHFGRLGPGAVMGAKNLKGIVIQGDGGFPLPEGKAYPRLYDAVYGKVTETEMMHKYHNLGTAENVAPLNALAALPIRNLQQTADPAMDALSGEIFADRALLRNAACAGCPIGCIHVGFVREKFMEPNQYIYKQVAYDFEPIFAAGAMLGITDPFRFLGLLDAIEKSGLDVMAAGVALAWATEALEKGIISPEQTRIPLTFGDADAYRQAVVSMANGETEFYRLLGNGIPRAAARYGGMDFACVLGQEMAGYATGDAFFVAQALGFRHSHLDTGGYSFDQKHGNADIETAVRFLLKDERERVVLTAMVSCLFARGVYTPDLLSECLKSVGYGALADALPDAGARIQALRWRTRLSTGYDPGAVHIPKRFTEVVNWKGPVDPARMDAIKTRYAQEIQAMGVA